MSALVPYPSSICHRSNPPVHFSRNQRRSGVTSRSTSRNAPWARSSTLSRRAAVKRTNGCAARSAFDTTGSFDRLVPGRNATTLSARSFRAHSESSGGRYGTRARFGAGAAAESVDMVSDDRRCRAPNAAPGPVGVVFFACLLRNQFVGTAAQPGGRQFDNCASFGKFSSWHETRFENTTEVRWLKKLAERSKGHQDRSLEPHLS